MPVITWFSWYKILEKLCRLSAKWGRIVGKVLVPRTLDALHSPFQRTKMSKLTKVQLSSDFCVHPKNSFNIQQQHSVVQTNKNSKEEKFSQNYLVDWGKIICEKKTLKFGFKCFLFILIGWMAFSKRLLPFPLNIQNSKFMTHHADAKCQVFSTRVISEESELIIQSHILCLKSHSLYQYKSDD